MRVNFGFLRKGQKKPMELVAEVRITRTKLKTLRCHECSQAGASLQEIELLSLRYESGKEITAKSPIFQSARKILQKELDVPFCDQHADRNTDTLSITETLTI